MISESKMHMNKILGFFIASFSFYVKILAERGNIARSKNTWQSKNFSDWYSGRAVDGKRDSYSSDCSSASESSSDGGPWWSLDLGDVYNVVQIDIYGPKYKTTETKDFDVYSGISEDAMTNIYHNDVVGEEYKKAGGHIIVDGNFTMRYLRIQNDKITYLTLCEVEVFAVCRDYQFGLACQKCYCHGAPCDKTTGICAAGCDSRWFGISCNNTCPEGRFGQKCTSLCRCLHPSKCDILNGTCHDGRCGLSWSGEYCNVSSSVATGKSVNMVSQFDTWEAGFAVDGNLTTLADACRCCAATEEGYRPWFAIDLGRDYRIGHITVYGRTDKQEPWQNYKYLNILGRRQNQTTETTIYQNNKEVYYLDIALAEPVKARHLRLVLAENNRLLVICELQIFEAQCDNGTFGDLCEYFCFCIGETCDGKTGICPSGQCQSGYRGTNCSIECEDGRFGQGCESTCGHCLNGSACDKYNGTCKDCSPGYIGATCKQQCPFGMFGVECLSVCGNCSDGETCDHVTGRCQNGCQPGYHTSWCNETCPEGNYGRNCEATCGHCYSNSTCDLVNGYCDSNGCLGDFLPPLCSTRKDEQTRSETDENTFPLSTGALAGMTVGVVTLILAIVVVVAVTMRRRLPKGKRLRNDFKDGAETDKQVTDKTKDSKVLVDPPSRKTKHKNKDKEISDGLKGVSVTRAADEYYEFAPRKEDIKIHLVWDYIQKGRENGCSLFGAEFQSFQKGLQLECKTARKKENLSKHKYKEIYAYDYNRVKLYSDDGEELYINASFIDGYERVSKFIASQGPTGDMVEDFLTMIRQKRCTIVVMLTDTYENDVLKCLKYWPTPNDEVTFGKYTVKVEHEEVFSDYILRHIQIQKKEEQRNHVFKQFHFLSWPDKTVPTTAWSLVNFWRAVDKQSKLEDPIIPILVHCSAGVGRTGTFIAIDNLNNQARREGCIRPMQIVETLRRQRVNMVQTKEQYVYLHEAVAEALLLGTHFVLPTQFEEVYAFLNEKAEDGNDTNLAGQFKLLEKSLENDNTDSYMPENLEPAPTSRQSEPDTVYSNDESTECRILSDGQTLQADAVYTNVRKAVKLVVEVSKAEFEITPVLDFKNEESIILLEEPKNDEMMKGFWKLLTEKHATTVILIQASGNSHMFSASKTEKKENLSVRDILPHGQSKKDVSNVSSSVKLFEYTGWKPKESVVPDQQTMLSLLAEVFIWQTHLSQKNPIIIIKNDSKQAGVVCVLLNELARIKALGQINILETVKRLRKNDMSLVNSFDQYKFCHDGILRSIKAESDVYQNV